MQPVKREAAEKLRSILIQQSLTHMYNTTFASNSLCAGTMTSRQGIAVAMEAFGNARHAQIIIELTNPMAPKMIEGSELE